VRLPEASEHAEEQAAEMASKAATGTEAVKKQRRAERNA